MRKKFTKKSKKVPVKKAAKKAVKNKPIKSVSKKPPDKKPKRDAHGRLMKGHTANPAGRPKGTYKYGEWYQDKLNSKKIDISIAITRDGKTEKQRFKYSADKSFRELLFVKLFQKALDGEIMAIRELLDRSEGKPTQPIRDESDSAIMEALNALSPADLKKLIKG